MANFMNKSNRAGFVSSATVNQNQGGGDKKAGFPYIVGRTQWTNIAFNTDKNGSIAGRCDCSLKSLKFTANPNVKQSRPTQIRPANFPRMF
jgi:hypothetical protein